LFHQWGAIQLLLIALLVVLFFRYPGLTPLIVLTLAGVHVAGGTVRGEPDRAEPKEGAR
jgi:hypothetical protein